MAFASVTFKKKHLLLQKYFHSFIVVFLFLTTYQVSGQQEKSRIILAFDSVVFYPGDSIIEEAFTVGRFHKRHGYAIEFDSAGTPVVIGEYKHGKEDGYWLYANGNHEIYKNGDSPFLLIPGCGTGAAEQRETFKKLYRELLDRKKRKK